MPHQAAALRQSTLRLLETLAAGPIAADVLAQAKQRLATQVLIENETYSQQAATLAFYEGLGAGAEATARYVPTLETLTAKHLQAAIPTRLLAWITLGGQPEEER